MIATLAAAAAAAAAAAGPDPLAALSPTAAATAGSHGALGAVGMVVLLTLVTLLPAIVLSCTCFVRFIVVLGFVRTGIGTPAAPPNQVLVGLALFMSVFVSAPVATQIYDRAGRAYLAGQIDEVQAFDAATPPLRSFLLHHTTEADLTLFYEAASAPRPATIDEVPLKIAIPAFLLSELRLAFKIGLTILLPFLVIDLVAATILTSLGMVMVPPQVVALPIKLLVFVMIDGWHLVVQSLLRGAMT
ncbi:MAG TPA: flagellar type III secretion system pore protein FliP [Kofleriaceae bacterium]|nr:flagellar type III secretion system pore protein FliP [Kofleriaceae bacterium]